MAVRAQSGTYGLLACFTTADALVAAARRTRRAGYRRFDAFTPFPVEGLVEAMGRGTAGDGVRWLALVGFLVGAAGAFALQYYSAVLAYPFDAGGRPLNSWPAFLIVSFEMGVLVCALTVFVGSFVMNGLPRLHHPLFAARGFDLGTRNRFFLCIEATDPLFEAEETRDFLMGLEPQDVQEVAP